MTNKLLQNGYELEILHVRNMTQLHYIISDTFTTKKISVICFILI
jgi:hypothetical protein